MYRVPITSYQHNLPNYLVCALLFHQRISSAFSLVVCPADTRCFTFLNLLSLQYFETGVPYLNFPSLYWGLVNVPRQKAQVSHLICFHFLRNDSLVSLVVHTLSIFASYIWSSFLVIQSRRVVLLLVASHS